MDEGMGHERTPLPYHSEDLDALEGIPGQETEPFRANCGHTEISEAVVYSTIPVGSDVRNSPEEPHQIDSLVEYCGEPR